MVNLVTIAGLFASGMALLLTGFAVAGMFDRDDDETDRQLLERRIFALGTLIVLLGAFGSLFLIETLNGWDYGVGLRSAIMFGGFLFFAIGWPLNKVIDAVQRRSPPDDASR